MSTWEVAVEFAFPLILTLIVVLNSSDDFAEEFQCGLDAFLVIFDDFCDLVEEEPELLLTVKTLYREAYHMVKQAYLAPWHWAVALTSLQVPQENGAKDSVGVVWIGRGD